MVTPLSLPGRSQFPRGFLQDEAGDVVHFLPGMSFDGGKALGHQVGHRVQWPLPAFTYTVPIFGSQHPLGLDAREQGLKQRPGRQRVGSQPEQRAQDPAPLIGRVAILPR